jgi:multicomponent Na+:H+ antiporter subunit E
VARDMNSHVHAPRDLLRASLPRAALLFAFWLILSGFGPADILVGAFASVLATSASLRLLPPAPWRFRLIALMRLGVRFFYQSIAAGVDVAWRAFDPRLPLRPGFVSYPVRFPPGTARNVFAMITSLMPGAVPAGDDDGDLVYHCIDVGQPVVSQLTAEETALSRAIGDD